MNINEQASPTVSVAMEGQADLEKTDLQKSQAKRILCLWLPEWPIQRLIVAEPELRQQRVVLFRTDSRKGKTCRFGQSACAAVGHPPRYANGRSESAAPTCIKTI